MNNLAINGGEKTVKTAFPARHHFGAEEKAACNRVMDEAIAKGVAPGYNGPDRGLLGEEFAALLGGGYAECVNSGTTSVYVALRSQDIQPFTEIICGPITDPGGLMPIVMMNCIPVIADAIPGSFNMSLESVKKAYTERTSAIVVAHIAGEPCEDIEAICEFAKEKGIKVIEDCAQAHGAKFNGKPVGTFGDASGFSMMFGKHTCVGGQGGLVWTRTEEAYYRARQAADRGKPYGAPDADGNVCASLNYNMDDMHAAIGRVQIQKMFPIAEKRREVVAKIKAGLADVAAVSFTPISENSDPSFWFLRILFNEDAVTVDKKTFCDALVAEGVDRINTYYMATPYTSEWYRKSVVFGNSGYPWAAPEYKGDKEKRYSLADLPVISKTLDDTFMIYPVETWTDENVNELCAAFKKVYEAYKRA
ncbi:MAG: DegT/DnrJ/EryC1/StrS family aminotransferase [Oscillospiraceae bacterium]|nr:DegT/DnrJ/EryC1/StrS family aminotransferase [Oscillospiraceae bacterium]MBQ4544629.1 DegT/DnrJ/EryC1/StrS family aminotransferase [Oscillospiraceae bacterium]MBQ6901734.1 DegT/DnrJ/EryC1/StrS family aminotransferase [Oscillospiraceae bacterium]